MGAPQLFAAGPTTGGTPVGGSGTPDTIPVWSSGTTLTNSPLVVSGTNAVGFGTPKTWGTNFTTQAMQLSDSASLSADINTTYLSANWYLDATYTARRIKANFAGQYRINGATGDHTWLTGASGAADSALTLTTAMTLTQAGNVAIGNTPTTDLAGYKALEVGGLGSGFVNADSDLWITANAKHSGGGWKYAVAASTPSNSIRANAGAIIFNRAIAGTASNAITWLESARIDSSGNVGIGTPSPSHRLAVVGGDIFRHNTFTDASNYKGTRLSSATYSGAEYSTLTVVGIGTFAASNIGLVLQPLGTGAITAQMPDGTVTGGNARGQNAVDFQTLRATAAQVASGNYSFAAGYAGTASAAYAVAIGATNTASGTASVALGAVNTASGERSFAAGDSNTASGSRAVAIGQSCTASGGNSIAMGATCTASNTVAVAMGSGNTSAGYGSTSFGEGNAANASYTVATGNRTVCALPGQIAHANGRFAASGDAQISRVVVRCATANASPLNLTLDGAALAATNALSLPNNTAWAADVHIVARSATGAGHAYFVRRVLIKRDANAASTALVGTVQTIGTDIGSNAGAPPAGWAVAITADTTNGALDIQATGAAATTIRWVARVELVEVGLA
jgi:hypothetical protein